MARRSSNATSSIPILITTSNPSFSSSSDPKMPNLTRRPRNSSVKPLSILHKDNTMDVSEMDHSTSTFGDEDMPAAIDYGASFMNKLEGSLLLEGDSSSESSYWSSSDDDEDDDEEDDDASDAAGGGGGEDEDEDDQSRADSESGASERSVEEPPVKPQQSKKDNNNNNNNNNTTMAKKKLRNNSVLSLDALLKVQMQLGDTKKPPTPLDREAKRRGRRLGKDFTATTLGALARKVGSSTGNEEMKEAAKAFRRSESSGNIPNLKPKPKVLHYQQVGSVQGQQQPPPPLRGLRSSIRVHNNNNNTPTTRTTMVDESTRSYRRSKYGEDLVNIKPRDHYLRILKNAGITAPLIRYDELEQFFLPVSPEDKAAFDMELVGAVRDQNLEKLQRLYAAGHPMQARSQFGESLVHICARRGTPEMLRFLLSLKGENDNNNKSTNKNKNAGVSCRVCCDYGRTPLHDAAWSTHAVSLEMMKILIMDCPDLLLVLDKRGFMPLDYIPKSRWEQCCAWLDKHKDILMPTGVLFGDSDSDSSSSGSEEDNSEEASESGDETD